VALAGAEAGDFGERLDAAGLALDLGPAPPDATVLADPDRMRQVLDNLFENSLRYTTAGGRVRLHAQTDGERLLLHRRQRARRARRALARWRALLPRRRLAQPRPRRRRPRPGPVPAPARSPGRKLHFAHSPLKGLRATIVMPLARHVESA
jgi:two-component system sensor histidine kinase BaeS